MKFYVDTSVWGGHDDKEFAEWTRPFFEQARNGLFVIILSNITLDELVPAPENIKRLPETFPKEYLELVTITPEQNLLANKYIEEGALPPKFYADAQYCYSNRFKSR